MGFAYNPVVPIVFDITIGIPIMMEYKLDSLGSILNSARIFSPQLVLGYTQPPVLWYCG
jgi:hypothetical protein